jgi:hypothetical protein
MPGSGTPLLWNENVPAETDIADAAPIRSIETSLRNGLAVEHNWPSASGPNFGYHLFGACRTFWDVESNVSSAGTDGRLMMTSDTSRLFGVGSGGTMLIGGQNIMSMGSSPVGGQRYYWAVEMGTGTTDGTGTAIVTFPNSGFSGVPFMLATASDASGIGTVASVTGVTNALATIKTFTGNTAIKVTNFIYMSLGTRVL